MIQTYENGCPRVGWCVACERPVALRADGELVPHRGVRGPCRNVVWTPLEDALKPRVIAKAEPLAESR